MDFGVKQTWVQIWGSELTSSVILKARCLPLSHSFFSYKLEPIRDKILGCWKSRDAFLQRK